MRISVEYTWRSPNIASKERLIIIHAKRALSCYLNISLFKKQFNNYFKPEINAVYITENILKKLPKTVLVDKIYLHCTDKQMQLINILLTATLVCSFFLQAIRSERKGNIVDIVSVLQFHSVAVTYHRARARRIPRLISIRNNQEHLFHVQRSAIFN